MKRALAVLFIGLGIVGISTLAGRRGGDERFAAAQRAVDAECHAFRTQPAHRHANVCRVDDYYGPRAIPMFAEGNALVDHARSAMAHGDTPGAESDLSRALAMLDDMEHLGNALATLTRNALLKSVLDFLAEHREIDATRLLRDVRFDLGRHPFAVEALNHRWYLVHWNEYGSERSSRSPSQLADAIEADTAAFQQMDAALVEHHDVAECESIAKKHELGFAQVLCVKLDDAISTAARLDATQHGRLSSAAR